MNAVRHYAVRAKRATVAALLALAAILALSVQATAQPAPHLAARAFTTDAASTLAARYSPVIAVQPHRRTCGPGEPYRPTTVGLILGNPEVVLRDSSRQIVARAPTAAQLAHAARSDYLDLPGDPLKPGCTYERQFKRWFGDRKPTVYAHVATDTRHPGRLAVQYWFFYTYNDFTNKHEGDWEMAQVDFDAATPLQALKTGPYEVDLAQHAGGERGAWRDDPKLTKVGTHPLEYVATGAHAGYFQRRVYLGKGGSAVFGCEDTRHSRERIPLQTVVLPDTPVPSGSPYAWLDFEGRWGQRQPGINNGPRGPAGSRPWNHPISWADGLRRSSLVTPGGRFLGLRVTSFFCGAVTDTAVALNWSSLNPGPFFGLAAAIVLALLATAKVTRWRPPADSPVRRARGGGQILRAAGRLYRGNPWTFLGIGAVFIPVSLLSGGVQWVLFHLTGLDRLVNLDGRQGAGTFVLAFFLDDIGAAFAAAVVTAAVAAALSELDAKRPITALRAYALAGRNARSLAAATLLQFVVMVLLILTTIGIPVAVYYFVRTSLFAQTSTLEQESALRSLRASWRLTGSHWWRTFGITILVDLIAILSGPLLGLAILLLTAQSLTFVDVAGSLVYALVIPYAAIALTLFYFDLHARRELVPANAAVPGLTVAHVNP